MNRLERMEVFEGTKKICESSERLQQAIRQSREKQCIYWEGESIEYGQPRFSGKPELILSPKKTVEAARPYAELGKRVCILNFASSVSPGGGVVQGSQAQEESICRVSTLYFVLSDPETAGKFYTYHWELIRAGKMNRRNRDDIVYTPSVMVVRDDAADEAMMKESDWYAMDVITCAAPDLRRTREDSCYAPTREELLAVHETRWSKILAAAARHEADVLILGAFGCGVFDNPPKIVVQAFNNVISKFDGYFETIEFAVYARDKADRNYQAFSRIAGIHESMEY